MRWSLLLLLGFFLYTCGPTYSKESTRLRTPNPEEKARRYIRKCYEYINQKKYNLAIEACTKAIELDPKRTAAYLNRGYAYCKKDQYDLAIKDYTKAIELDPNYVAAYQNRGLAYCDKGEYDLAIRDFTKAIELDPKNPTAYIDRGNAYDEKNEYDLAIRDFTKAIELDPRLAIIALMNRGFAFFKKGVYAFALKDFTKCIELYPNFYGSYENRGLTYAILGQWERARLDLMKAVKLAPKDAHAHYHLAFVLYKLGLSGEAQREIKKAAELDPQILEKYGKSFLKPLAERTLRFYAEEYLFAARYLKAPKKYLARARAILGLKEAPTALAGLEIETPSGSCVPAYPNRYLLAVLVSTYDELPELSFVRNDKKLIFKLATCFLGVPKNHILVLEDPTLAQFRRKSREFLSGIRKRDAVVFFYYSGHGVTDVKGRFYLLPRDASVKTEADLAETALSLSELEKKLSLARGMKLALLDACRVRVPWKPAVLVTEGLTKKDLALVFATASGKMSVAERSGRASAFLVALYRMASRGIENLDFDGSGYVELSELVKPLAVQVKKASGGAQRPEVRGAKTIPVFPVE